MDAEVLKIVSELSLKLDKTGSNGVDGRGEEYKLKMV